MAFSEEFSSRLPPLLVWLALALAWEARIAANTAPVNRSCFAEPYLAKHWPPP